MYELLFNIYHQEYILYYIECILLLNMNFLWYIYYYILLRIQSNIVKISIIIVIIPILHVITMYTSYLNVYT